MKILTFKEKIFWFAAREGKITGSRAGDLHNAGGPTKDMLTTILLAYKIEPPKSAKKEELEAMVDKLGPEARAQINSMLPKKLAFYELVAERLGVPADDEFPMERGTRLEKEAIERFRKETGKEVDDSLLMWLREDNPGIAISPDGVIVPKKKSVKITEACEVKCLKSSLHIKAYIENKIPEEYEDQALHYFVVNDDLKTLYFILFDPRFDMFRGTESRKKPLDYIVFELHREKLAEQIKTRLAEQIAVLEEVDKIVNDLTF